MVGHGSYTRSLLKLEEERIEERKDKKRSGRRHGSYSVILVARRETISM